MHSKHSSNTTCFRLLPARSDIIIVIDDSNIILMQDPTTHLSGRKKKSPQHTTTYKSPYFSSVRRNSTNSKQRIQNALMITKYPTANDQAKKKKVFKRFNKFQQIDQLYNADIGELKMKKNCSDRENKEPRHEERHRMYSNPKDILYSNKTLALAQKYSSYKSIIMSTPKIPKQSKQKIRRNSNFRTKVKSGHTIYWNSQSKDKLSAEGLAAMDKKDGDRADNQDWLCKELIKNQVYGVDDDDCF